MPGAQCTRGPCARKIAHGGHHRYTGITRHSLRSGLNGVLRALPGVRILLATVVRGLTDGALPGRAGTSSADLTPATGARTTRLGRTQHTFSPKASTGLVPTHLRPGERRFSIGRLRAVPSLTNSREPTLRRRLPRPTLPRPPHPAPRLVTIAKRPSEGDGMAEVVGVIWGKREADYSCGRSYFDLHRRANQCWGETIDISVPLHPRTNELDYLVRRIGAWHLLARCEL
jgi:hypothetical protein